MPIFHKVCMYCNENISHLDEFETDKHLFLCLKYRKSLVVNHK